MADFREILCIGLERKEQFVVYNYAWVKEDLVDNSTVDFDYEEECSYDELMHWVCDMHHYYKDKISEALLRFGKLEFIDEY